MVIRHTLVFTLTDLPNFTLIYVSIHSIHHHAHFDTSSLLLLPSLSLSLAVASNSLARRATLLSVSARNPGETGFSFQTAVAAAWAAARRRRRSVQRETEDEMCGRA